MRFFPHLQFPEIPHILLAVSHRQSAVSKEVCNKWKSLTEGFRLPSAERPCSYWRPADWRSVYWRSAVSMWQTRLAWMTQNSLAESRSLIADCHLKKIGLCKLYHISVRIVKFFNSYQYGFSTKTLSVIGCQKTL